MYEKTILNNGTTIISHTMPHMKSVALGIWIRAGGRYEHCEISGISHFLEHLLFKGTKKRTVRKIKESIEGVGGSLNAFTAHEFTCYVVKILGKYFPLALDVLSDMILNATLAESDIEREKTVIIEEIKMYRDMPAHYVSELLDNLLWPEQPLGRNLAGSPETIASLTRKDLTSYKKKFYNLHNVIVAAVGPISHTATVKEVKKRFSMKSPLCRVGFQRAHASQVDPQIHFLFKETEQAHMCLGAHALPRAHPDRYALSLLHIVLGANMSSRLFQELREKRGLAYEIASYVKRYRDTGAFIVSAGIDNAKVPQALEVILREVRRITEQPVKKVEFKRAKEFYKGQFSLALEDTMDHMLWMGEEMMTLQTMHLPEQIVKEIERVDEEDVMRVAQKIFKRHHLNLALIGRLKEKDRAEMESVFNSL